MKLNYLYSKLSTHIVVFYYFESSTCSVHPWDNATYALATIMPRNPPWKERLLIVDRNIDEIYKSHGDNTKRRDKLEYLIVKSQDVHLYLKAIKNGTEPNINNIISKEGAHLDVYRALSKTQAGKDLPEDWTGVIAYLQVLHWKGMCQSNIISFLGFSVIDGLYTAIDYLGRCPLPYESSAKRSTFLEEAE